MFGFDDEDYDLDALMAAMDAIGRHDPLGAVDSLDRDFDDDLAGALAHEAIGLLRDGRPDEAARRIDLFLHPKFADADACEAAYAKTLGARA